LFTDEDPAGAAAKRSSIVAPEKRSVRAERKATTHQTEDGLPVHSFQGLLANLVTLCKNRIKAELPSPVSFQQNTSATPLQRRAFELLEVTIDL
jgi:hypothetical protein